MTIDNRQSTIENPIDLIIIGAGPTGLACGIEAKKAGLSYLIIEQGGITDAIRRFPVNMTFFSTPELLELGDIPFTTPNVRPTRVEVLQYYRGISDYFELNLKLFTKVSEIKNQDKRFNLVTDSREEFTADKIIVATGYFDYTNRLGVKGEDLPHVSHFYTEPYAYSQTDVAVIGGRNSAVETALELYRHGARVTLIHRGSELGAVKYWILPDIENRIKDGGITVYFDSVVEEIATGSLVVRDKKDNKRTTLPIDFVFPLIGYRPNEPLLRSGGIALDSKTVIPEYNKTTFETNVRGLYIAGSVACGCETWNIFIENGRAHAKPIIEHILTDRENMAEVRSETDVSEETICP